MKDFLVFDKVSVRYPYDKTDIFSDLSFNLEEKERLLLKIVAQGGKTSIVKLIAGLIEPREGRILYKGTEIENVPPKERNLAVLYADYALLKGSVQKNLEFGLRLRETSDEEIEKRVADAVEIYGLDDIKNKNVKRLCAFDKFRVALARAEGRQVELLIADDCFCLLKERETEARKLVEAFIKRKQCAYLELASKEQVLDEEDNYGR